MASHSSQMPIPPPPPGGWSGACKTVIDPTKMAPKESVLATADTLSAQVVVPTDDAEVAKKKKAEKKLRQQQAKRALEPSKTSGDKLGLTQLPAKADDGKAEGQRGELEAASEGKLPGSSRGGTSDAAEGEHPMAVDEVQPMAVDEGERVDWADASDEQVDKQLRRSKYSCKGMGCEKDLYASQLMLMDPDDWCGDLTTYCFGCSGWANTEKSFMKEAKKRWTAYAFKHADKARRLRTLNFDDLEAYYEEKIQGVGKVEMRRIVVAHLRLVATVITDDIANESIFSQKARMLVYDEWMAAVQLRGANPFELPEHKGWSISAHDGQRLTRITKHCVISFICRDCGYYGPDWAEAVGKYWFRCYNCGTHYQPAAYGEKRSDYNKVIAMQDPITKQVKHLPAYWPPTQEDNWLAAQCEVYARQIESIEDLESFTNKVAVDINTLLKKAGNPTYYDRFVFGEDAQYKFSAPKWPLENHAHIIKDGFVGKIWRPENFKGIPVFYDWAELARLVGSMIAIGERMSKL